MKMETERMEFVFTPDSDAENSGAKYYASITTGLVENPLQVWAESGPTRGRRNIMHRVATMGTDTVENRLAFVRLVLRELAPPEEPPVVGLLDQYLKNRE